MKQKQVHKRVMVFGAKDGPKVVKFKELLAKKYKLKSVYRSLDYNKVKK